MPPVLQQFLPTNSSIPWCALSTAFVGPGIGARAGVWWCNLAANKLSRAGFPQAHTYPHVVLCAVTYLDTLGGTWAASLVTETRFREKL